ncbi:cobalamin B12-binding domain-containing protein [Aquibacillus koreensis]|uniref:Cobalamin B12-binding domain-containing protein n=1 Tax=Aquibacillus koreensis TaxID=279446 RepID=A0A9X4AI41_9BACI|nr:cobalamin B12-binding domain-containing protein [Aquibacillus koreensis]MCT2537467.1 cobalamin B12-binding domain-containing protein [Aquibacillus koreensis]MDC3418913.1 cobalamin B12-binding domain-containing protein [Aquibacillus koreensis]
MSSIRILIGKVGLDGHNRGALVLAEALRENEMEVIYSGLRQTPEQIVKKAIAHNVHIIGLSSMAGAHRHIFPQVLEELKMRGITNVPVIGGGIIPACDLSFLFDQGVSRIFTRSDSIDEIVKGIQSIVITCQKDRKIDRKETIR